MSMRVFTTYAHESNERKKEVLELSEQLRRDGIDSRIDQYEPHPPEGWPTWMETQLREADAVLLVPSPKYLERYYQTAGIGSGGRFEAAIVKSHLLKSGVSFSRLGIISFTHADNQYIPELLHGCTRYALPSDYQNLYRWLTNQPATPPSAIGNIIKLSTANEGSLDFSFTSLCRSLKPILDDNRRIFLDFGPNSGADTRAPLRMNLESWYDLRRSKIIPNNRKIRQLLIDHRQAIPIHLRVVFDRLTSHIDAFEAHVSNEKIDYREHQFPKEIASIIENELSENG